MEKRMEVKNSVTLMKIAMLVLMCMLFICRNSYAVDYDVSVVDFGASGSDKLSDSLAFQNALDKAKESSTVVTIYVPAGTYYLDRGVTMYSNTHLILDSKAVVIRNNEEEFMLQSYRDNETGGYGQFHDITIEGGTWDGNIKSATEMGTPMMFYHGENLIIKDVNFKNYCSRHMVIIAGVKNARVENCSFANAFEYKGTKDLDKYNIVEEDGSFNKEANFRCMEALHFDCINVDGMTEFPGLPYDNTANIDVVVENCTFNNVFSGIGGHCDYNPIKSENYTVKNCTFTDVKYTCVDVFGTTGAVITGNEATKSGELVRMIASEGNITDNKATITVNKDYNMYAVMLKDSKADITNCEFTNASNNGVYLYNSTVDKMEKVSITNATENGIAVVADSSINLAKDLTITKSGICGIYANKSNTVNVTNCTITDSKECGFASEDCKNVSIKESTIEQSGTHAVSIIGTSSSKYAGTITGNTIKDCDAAVNARGVSFDEISNNNIDKTTNMGIALRNDVVAQQVSDNTIKGTGDDAIFVSTKSSIEKISKNIIVSSSKDGIYIKDNSSVDEVSENDISQIGQYGLFVSASNALLDDNKITVTTKHGINISQGSDVTVSNNAVTSAGQYGIYSSDSNGEIKGNTVDKSAGAGIGVATSTATSSKRFIVTSNTVLSSGNQGVYIYNSSNVSIEGNTISQSQTQGIKLNGSANVIIKNNDTSNNVKQGIMPDGSDNCTIEGNKVLNNGDYGIYITACKNINVNGNSSASNAKADIVANNATTGTFSSNAVGEGGIVTNWGNSTVTEKGTTTYKPEAEKPQTTVGSSYYVPDGTKAINKSEFSGNTKLKYIYIPSSVTTIEESAFAGCTALKQVYYQGSEADYKKITVKSGNDALTKAAKNYSYYKGFTDVSIKDWFTPSVSEAYNLGIITGLKATVFGPNDNLSRAMAVTILSRVDDKIGYVLPEDGITEPGFKDVTNPKKWYYKYVLWAKRSGVVTGYSKGDLAGCFGPDDNITRQDFALIMFRYVKERGGDVSIGKDAANFKLAKGYSEISKYARDAVQWCYENGIMGVGSALNPKNNITRAETAAIILRVLNYLGGAK